MKLARIVLAACALFVGCEEPKLPKSWRITYARVLAVRAEVVGDEARATPEPGERVRVRVLIVGDRPIERLSYALVACPAGPPRGELPSCIAEPFFVDQDELDGDPELARELVVELQVPDEDALEGAERLLIGGTLCTDGAAEPEEGGEGRCADGAAQPVTFAAHVAIARGDDTLNHNPVIGDDAIRFDGRVWPPDVLLAPASDDDGGVDVEPPDAGALPSVRADGEEHEIAISLEGSAREVEQGGPEELLLSHFVTAGVLGRRFSVLEREQDGRAPVTVKWRMPVVDNPPPRVLAVFVLRDQRGGVAYALRWVAVD